MALLMATISGQFLKPDLGKSARTYVIEAATDAARLEVSGKVIEGRIPVKIRTDGTATVTIPQLPQAGLSPVGAQWALYRRRDGRDVLVKTFTLTADITWDAIVDTSNVPVTPALVTQAQALLDQIRAVGSLANWAPLTAYTAGDVRQAPDGTTISRLTSGTSTSTFAADAANWTAVATKAGTIEQAALDVRYPQKGSAFYNVADFASLSAALAAIPAGSTLFLPAGTYSANQITTLTKSVVIQGVGSRASIIDAGANSSAFAIPSPQSPVQIEFRNVGFKGSTGRLVHLSRDVISRATFVGCRFSAFGQYGIECLGTELYVDGCSFDGDGTATTSKTGITVDYGPERVSIRSSTFRYLYRGFYCVDTNGPAADVLVHGNDFDGGWSYFAATASGSGGTVTYTSTVLTDTGGSLAGVTAGSTVRAMAVKRTGTTSANAAGKLTDAAANFTTAAVKRGDIVRTAAAWAVVDEVVSATVLKVENWLNLSDYDYAQTPAATTAYTIYGLVIGKVASATGTTVTVDQWRDWDGTVATPAAGTRYEIHRALDYQGVFILRADRAVVTDNHVRRSWADQIAVLNGRRVVVTGNNISDGQDVGVTVQVTVAAANQEALVANNRITHQGSAGIYCAMPDSRLLGNNIVEPNWMSLSTSTYGGIMIDTNASGTRAQGNLVKRVNHPNANKAVHVNGTVDKVYLDNDTVGYAAAADLAITGAGVTNVTGRFQLDTVILLLSSGVGPIGDFVSSGVPAFPASAGSTCRRKGGGASTSFYVKETTSASTTWRAV